MIQVLNPRVIANWLDSERTRTVYKNILISFFLKGASIIISFLVVPLTLTYVSTENYGIWMTISALTLWFGLIDVSFGNGLRNQLVTCFAKGDFDLARSLLSTLYTTLFIGALILSSLLYVSTTYVNWASFFHIKSEYQSVVRQSITIMLIGFSLQIALKPINALLLADQRASMTSWLLLFGNALALAGIYIATHYTRGSLLTLACIQSIAPIVVFAMANIWLFSTRYRHIAPSIHAFKFNLGKRLFNSGGQFLFLQIVSVLMFSSGNLIISYLLDSEKVAIYSIATRYFSVIPLLYGIIITPYWSAFTEAYVKQDYSWIAKTLKKLNRLACLSIIVALLMVHFADVAYSHWIGTRLKVPITLSASLACYSVSYAFLSNYNYLINGIGRLRLLVYVSLIGIIAFIPFNYLLVVLFKMDLPGVVWVSIGWNIILLLFCRTQSRKLLNGTARGIWNR